MQKFSFKMSTEYTHLCNISKKKKIVLHESHQHHLYASMLNMVGIFPYDLVVGFSSTKSVKNTIFNIFFNIHFFIDLI